MSNFYGNSQVSPTREKIKIAYVWEGSAIDIYAWSGTIYYILESLKKAGFELYPVILSPGFLYRVFGKICKIAMNLLGKSFHPNRTIFVSKKYARKIINKLQDDTDIIFAPTGTIPMAFLKCLQKKIIYNDATMACLIDYYSQFSNLCRKTIHEGNILDKMAFNNCDLLLMASEWAAESAISDYRINPEKVKVVPFGANMENDLTDKEISEIIYSRSTRNVCNLLFVGVDWERKGGSIAVEIAGLLHKRGIEVHLDIIGIRKKLTLSSYIINHGFISKFTETGRKKIENLYKNASFFVLPTRAECAGIVFCEAASYGLPSIATKTGGVSTYIKDNFNGMTFPVYSSPKLYADYIEKIFLDKKKYEQLCFQSFLDYKKRLNWEAVGWQIKTLIKEIL